MNTKAIQLLTRAPAFGARFFIYAAIVATAMASVCYMGSTASYFFLAAHSDGHHDYVNQLGDEVLKQIGTINDGRLSEISGIVESPRYSESFWVHNDSGNPAELFLIDHDGQVLVRLELSGAKNRDWEDICAFEHNGQSYICVGDVGDNKGRYESYFLYIFKEPELDIKSVRGTGSAEQHLTTKDYKKFEFSYEDGPKNCEAFAFDQSSHSFLLAEKGFDRKSGAKIGLYQLKLDLEQNKSNKKSNVAKRVANCGLKTPTAMAISANGKRLIISSYAAAGIWSLSNGSQSEASDWISTLANTKPTILPLPLQRQGEAIALDATGGVAVTTSEHTGQPLWKIQVDAALKTLTRNSDAK